MKNDKKHQEEHKKIKTVSETFTQEDYENMMKHSSYKRCKGGIRQVR